MTGASRAIVSENLWRAQRDGVRASFIDETNGKAVRCKEYLSLILDKLAREIGDFDCVLELDRAKLIVEHGTSSDFQLAITNGPGGSGAGATASPSVVDWIARLTAGTECL